MQSETGTPGIVSIFLVQVRSCFQILGGSKNFHRNIVHTSQFQINFQSVIRHQINDGLIDIRVLRPIRFRIDKSAIRRTRPVFSQALPVLSVGINAHAVEEYAQTKERFDDLSRQKEDMTKAESDLRGLIKRLLSQMEKQFVTEFDRLNGYFQQTFVRLFGGGQAELKLTDPNDPLCCGIEVVAQPPGKKLQLLSLLSGGERALTAIAILFAMLKVKPSPFCILDEIEAALDDANISYFADYLVEFAKTTQFVVVTHRKGTMERCDSLYGVAMEEKGVSSMVSVNLENYH